MAVRRHRRDRPLSGPCVHSACFDDSAYCSHPPPRLMAWRLPLRRGGCCRHAGLFAVRGVCSPERGPRPCRHAFSFNRHACPRGVPLVISYATWRTVLYGVAYPGRHGGSTRHACLGRGGQHRHVPGRGAHGRPVRHAWRTSSFPVCPARHAASAFRTRGVPPFSAQPPRGWAWRLGTPRVAYPVSFVRHALGPACPCVPSHRAPGRRPARSSPARSGRLPCPGECLHQSSSRAADWQESAAGVVLPGVFLLPVWLSQLFVRPQAVEAPAGPGALPAARSVGSPCVAGQLLHPICQRPAVGVSPCVRGWVCLPSVPRDPGGWLPVRAGQLHRSRRIASSSTVDPRACGPMLLKKLTPTSTEGRSPSVRGPWRGVAVGLDFSRIRIGLLPGRRGTASDGCPGRSRPGFDPVRAGNASILPPPAECFWCSPVRAGKRQISAKQRVVKEVYPRPLEGIAVSVQPVLNGLPRARCVRGTG